MARRDSLEAEIQSIQAALDKLLRLPRFRGQRELIGDVRAQLTTLRKLQAEAGGDGLVGSIPSKDRSLPA